MRLNFLYSSCSTRPIVSALLWAILLIYTPSPAAQSTSTTTLRSMARIYMAYGNYDKAQTIAETALAQAQRQNITGEELAMCLIDLGTVYSYQDMLEESADMLNKGIQQQKQSVGNHPYVAYTLQILSDVYCRAGQYDRAQETLDKALLIMSRYHKQQDREMLTFQASSAKLLAAQGQAAQAGILYCEILARTIELYGDNHLQTANVLMGAARADLLEGNIDSAGQRLNQAMLIQEKYFGPNHQMLIEAWLMMAQINRAAGNAAEAEIWLDKVIQAAQTRHNAVTLARLYEKINTIRTQNVYMAMAK